MEDVGGAHTVTMRAGEQCLVLFLHDGPLVLLDDNEPRDIDLPDYLPSPVMRAVAVARLRAWADQIERVTPPEDAAS